MASFIKILDDSIKALVFNKFKSYLDLTIQSKDLEFAPKSIAQRRISEKRGENKLEFISIWRNPPELDWARQRTPLARQGMILEYQNEDRKDFIVVKAIPAILNY